MTEHDLVSMDRFVDNLLKLHKKGEIDSKKVLDDLDFYNRFSAEGIYIDQFEGDKKIFFGFDVVKMDDNRWMFKSVYDGKQHMFSYDAKTKTFFGKKRIHDLTNIGLKYKRN